MSARAQDLATQFQQANDEFISFITGLSADEWLTVCPNEERTMAALAIHVAGAYLVETRAFRGIAEGQDPPAVAKEYLDRVNAENGATYANIDLATVIEKLRQDAPIAAEFVRSLNEEQLQRVGSYVDWIPPMSVEMWIERVLIGHIRMHQASMRAVLNRPTAPTS